MSWWEILLIIAAAGFVVTVFVVSVIRRKQGKSSCDCGGNCSACMGCHCAACDAKEPPKKSDHTPSP